MKIGRCELEYRSIHGRKESFHCLKPSQLRKTKGSREIRNVRVLQPSLLEHNLCHFFRTQRSVLMTMHDSTSRHEESVVEIFFSNSAIHFCRRESEIFRYELSRMSSICRSWIWYVRVDEREDGDAREWTGRFRSDRSSRIRS